MIDTMGFLIPVSDSTFSCLLLRSVKTERNHQSTGENEFEYHNFDTKIPSHNYSIKWGLKEQRYVYDDQIGQPFLENGHPHIRVEFSAPKVLYGHNLISVSPVKSLDALFLVKESFEKKYDVKLPPIRLWFPYRIDVCANFVLNNIFEVKNYIRHLQAMEYPRRGKPNNYGDNGIYFQSRYSVLKAYAKGDEFKKHDMKRIVLTRGKEEAESLHEEADKIFRVEAELKNRLRYIAQVVLKNSDSAEKIRIGMYNGYLSIYDLFRYVDIGNELKDMIGKMMVGLETKIMECTKVLEILKAHYSARQANSFHHVYLIIVTQGMSSAKHQFSKEKLMRAKRAFKQHRISMVSDVKRIDNVHALFPADFSLSLSSANKYYQVPVAA